MIDNPRSTITAAGGRRGRAAGVLAAAVGGGDFVGLDLDDGAVIG
jgi:hypothetical protein